MFMRILIGDLTFISGNEFQILLRKHYISVNAEAFVLFSVFSVLLLYIQKPPLGLAPLT